MIKNSSLYSVAESYDILYKAFRTAKFTMTERKKGTLNAELLERIMLAVTEVNNCPICSYAHTKMALEAGMSANEIENMLSGVLHDVPSHELPAIMFAQHYADTRGKPSRESWQRLVTLYGLEKAKGILGGTRAIMMGNVYGIAWSSFIGRLKGKPDGRSSLSYEVSILATMLPFALMAMVHAVLSSTKKISGLSLP